MKRPVSKWALSGFVAAALLFMAVLLMLFFVATEAGTRLAWRQLQSHLPDTVNVTAAEGRLIGPMVWKGIEVRSEAVVLQIDRVELRWTAGSLLRMKVAIQSLVLEGVRCTLLPARAKETRPESKPQRHPEKIALPVAVLIDQLRLHHIEYRSAPAADPVKVDRIRMKLSIDKEHVDLSELLIEAPRMEAQGSAGVSMNNDIPIKGTLRWRLDPPDYPEMVGHTKITGRIGELNIRQQIDAPYGVDASVTIEDLLVKPRLQARIQAMPEKLNAISKVLPEVAIQANTSIQGTFDKLALHLTATLEEADLGSADLEMDAGIDAKTLSIKHLTLALRDRPSRLTADGQLALSEGFPFHINTDWKQFQWPLTQPHITSPHGHLSVKGRADDYTVTLNADLRGPEHTKASLKVAGRGTLSGVALNDIDMQFLEGGIRGTAALDWNSQPAAMVDLQGKGLNPGVVFPRWPGDLLVRLIARGRVTDKGPEVVLTSLEAEGRLRGQAFLLEAEGAHQEERTTVNRFILSSGATRLRAQGNLGDIADIDWMINSEDLGNLHPEAGGRIEGKGRLTGPTLRPRVEVDLKARDVVYGDYRLKSLNLAADLDLAGEDNSSITVGLLNGRAPGVDIRKLDLTGHGNAGEHAVILLADTRQGKADLEIRGSFHRLWQTDATWFFQPVKAILSYPKLDAWTLREPFSGQVRKAQLMLSQNCWQSGQAQICALGQYSGEEVRAELEINDLPFSYFKDYFPKGLEARGGLSGKGAYRRKSRSAPIARVDLTTTKTGVWSMDGGPAPSRYARRMIEFLPGTISVVLQGGHLKADMALPVSDQDGIRLEAAISSGEQPLMDRPLTARFRTGFQNLEFIEAWVPEVEDLTGRLHGDLAFSGSLRHPALRGTLELGGGAARLERPGLALKDINLTFSGEESGAMRLTGRAVSGQGEINIRGTADFRSNATQADIRVTGKNVTVLNTSEATVTASPDLTIGLSEERVNVEGVVEIPMAAIQIKKVPASAVSVSADQTIAAPEEAGQDQKRVRKMSAHVRVILGEAVTFDGFGLSAVIRGGLLAIEKPGEPTTGSGELNIMDGSYEAFGQKLEVEKGRVLFAGGPIDRPGIDARAVRRPAEGVLVGVNVRGDLRQPDVTLFSDPPMTQGNQLSYLVLGRPLSGASAGEGSALNRAVLALGLKGGNVVAREIGGKLGLDQFSVESSSSGSNPDAQQASLVVGKYLTPRLYINYGIGLFDPVSTLRLQYAITSNWKLVTESSSTASGGDLIYTIETGR